LLDASAERVIGLEGTTGPAFDGTDEFCADDIGTDICLVLADWLENKWGSGIWNVFSRIHEPYLRTAMAVHRFGDARKFGRFPVGRDCRCTEQQEQLIALPFVVGDAVDFGTVHQMDSVVFQKTGNFRSTCAE